MLRAHGAVPRRLVADCMRPDQARCACRAGWRRRSNLEARARSSGTGCVAVGIARRRAPAANGRRAERQSCETHLIHTRTLTDPTTPSRPHVLSRAAGQLRFARGADRCAHRCAPHCHRRGHEMCRASAKAARRGKVFTSASRRAQGHVLRRNKIERRTRVHVIQL